jgi:hypothetical protein
LHQVRVAPLSNKSALAALRNLSPRGFARVAARLLGR